MKEVETQNVHGRRALVFDQRVPGSGSTFFRLPVR